MRLIVRLLGLIILISPLAIVAAVWFALADRPLVTGTQTFSPDDIARAEQLIRANDPRRLPPGTRNAIFLPAKDLDLLAGYLIERAIGAQSRITLADNRLLLQTTRTLPRLPMRQHLNLELSLRGSGRHLTIERLQLGALRIPVPLARWAARQLIGRLPAADALQLTLSSIEAAELRRKGLRLTYTWHPAVIDEAADTLLAELDAAALRHYHDRLVELHPDALGRRGSLADLLQTMFSEARDRSGRNEPAAENAALISVLGAWASRGLERLVPDAAERPGSFRLTLRNRRDFAKHFLISAALSARGDSTLSNAVGLVKEIIDADRGSGFSFSDIAADLAGSRFGELAVGDHSAAGLQSRIAAGVTDQELMPPADDLPEYMDSNEFRQRFERVGSPAYEAVMAKIRRRVDSLALYR